MHVQSPLEQWALSRPDKLALVCGEQRLTYREVDESSNRLAHSLVTLGLRRGDRVVIFLENSPEAVYAIFAALKAGGVFVMVNPTTKADKLAYILNDCRATILITDARRQALVRQLEPRLSHLREVIVTGGDSDAAPNGTLPFVTMSSLLAAAAADRLPVQGIDIDLAALIYTSGSTGHPKGVMMTHLNITTAARSITAYLENTSDDVILDVLPLSFDYGLYQVLLAFWAGATIVLERSFTYPHSVLEVMMRERVTGFPIVPTIAALLLQLDLGQYDFSALRYLTSTGDVLPTAHIAELRRLLPHARIYSMYGLTECKRVSFLPPEQIDIRPNSVGRGMPNEELYLVDVHGDRVESGWGELVIRGSHVMQGYWERPEETDRVLKPGPTPGERVLHSGDIFRMDDEGFLYFVGRTDDIIKTCGEKVSPKEVENILHTLPGVAQSAVVGVPDQTLGHAVKAVVVLRPGARLREQDVLQHCRQNLEDFMVPHIVEFYEALPKTSSGKVNRRLLRSSATSEPDGTSHPLARRSARARHARPPRPGAGC